MATNKDYNGYWFFWGKVAGKFYFYEDMDNIIFSKKEALKTDVGIHLYIATGKLNYIPENFRNGILEQNALQERLAKEEEFPSMWWVYINTGLPMGKIYI